MVHVDGHPQASHKLSARIDHGAHCLFQCAHLQAQLHITARPNAPGAKVAHQRPFANSSVLSSPPQGRRLGDRTIEGKITAQSRFQHSQTAVGLAGDHHRPRPRLITHCLQQGSDSIHIGQLRLAHAQISSVNRHDAQAAIAPRQPANAVAPPDLAVEEDERTRRIRVAVMNDHIIPARDREPRAHIRSDVPFTHRTHLGSRQILRRPHHPRVGPDKE